MAKIIIDESGVQSLLMMADSLEESAYRISGATCRLQKHFEENKELIGPHESSFNAIFEMVENEHAGNHETVSNISKTLRQAADAIQEIIECK